MPTDDAPSLLIIAAEHGNVQIVRELLEHGARTEERGLDGETALIAAAHSAPDLSDWDDLNSTQTNDEASPRSGDYLACIQLLIAHHANVNAQCEHYGTVLMCAADYNQYAMVSTLLVSGADPNQSLPPDYWPPFVYAAGNGNIRMMQLLLDHHIDINWLKSKDGVTALQQAVFSAKPSAVRFLLEHGANRNVTLSDGDTLSDVLDRCEKPGADLILHMRKEYKAR